MVIPPVLNLLYHAYGFAGALPRPDMDPARALAAPQALLLSTLARGIFLHQLDWTMILLGVALGAVLVAVDALLRRGGRYAAGAGGRHRALPAAHRVSVTLVIGALLSWAIRVARASGSAVGAAGDPMLETVRRRGVMLASGLHRRREPDGRRRSRR